MFGATFFETFYVTKIWLRNYFFYILRLTMATINIKDCNWTRTHNHLVHKRTLNHLAKPAKVRVDSLWYAYVTWQKHTVTVNMFTLLKTNNYILKTHCGCKRSWLPLHFCGRIFQVCFIVVRGLDLKHN